MIKTFYVVYKKNDDYIVTTIEHNYANRKKEAYDTAREKVVWKLDGEMIGLFGKRTYAEYWAKRYNEKEN